MSSQKVGSVDIKAVNRNLREACITKSVINFRKLEQRSLFEFEKTLFHFIVYLPPSYIL